MNYKISVKAAEDIENIWLYTLQNWSLEQADRYVNLIFAEIKYLAQNHLSGKEINNIRKNYRCSKVKSHFVFYRTNEKQKEIEVIRILHQQMDIENRLSD